LGYRRQDKSVTFPTQGVKQKLQLGHTATAPSVGEKVDVPRPSSGGTFSWKSHQPEAGPHRASPPTSPHSRYKTVTSKREGERVGRRKREKK
jgi:hypothetical protein